MSFDWQKRKEIPITTGGDKLPVSVVLVAIKSRMEFVKSFVLPSIEANNPAEIIIIDDDELTNQEKRNKGAYLASQKYLFICDDDVVMPKLHLDILCKTLDEHVDIAFAYTDYQAIVMNPQSHPKGGNYYQSSREFNIETLKFNNYIDTCSLVRRNIFPGFDPKIKRFQDWDLWLTLGLNGFVGKYVKDTGIIKYYLDEGITSKKTNVEECRNIILEKHGLSGLLSIMFVDTGLGFNPLSSISKELYVTDDKFEIEFDLSAYNNISRLRFDPVESKVCQVGDLEFIFFSKGRNVVWDKKVTSNAREVIDDQFIFETNDPQIYVKVEDGVEAVKVKGTISFESTNTADKKETLTDKIKSIFSWI